MKHLSVLFVTLALLSTGMTRPLQAQEDTVSFELFYDTLEPYGEWVEIDGYGYCWQPFVAADDPAWRPYADGWWSNTDAGWTWVSNEDFGWATYHYGRWTRLVGHGWLWVPGYDWAPAWVSWRHSSDQTYVGWAPLPPEAQFEITIGFNTWVDDYYDLGPTCYNFVRYQDFGEPALRTVILPYERNVTILTHSVNITHISYNDRVVNNIYVGGPDYNFVRSRSAREVRHLTLQRNRDVDYNRFRGNPREYSRSLNRHEGDTFVVASPGIRRFRDDERKGPAKVREAIREVRFDRGWDRVQDKGAADVIRTRMREDADRTRPKTLPSKSGPIASRDGRGRDQAPGEKPAGKPEGPRTERGPAVAVKPADSDAARRMEAEREKDRRAPAPDKGAAERSAAMMNETRERERRETAEAQKREEMERRGRMEGEQNAEASRRAEAMRAQDRREREGRDGGPDRSPRPGGAPKMSGAEEQQGREAMERQQRQGEESRKRTMEEAQRNQVEEGRRRAMQQQQGQAEEGKRRAMEGQRQQAEEGRRKAMEEAQKKGAGDERRRTMESQSRAQQDNAVRAQQENAAKAQREAAAGSPRSRADEPPRREGGGGGGRPQMQREGPGRPDGPPEGRSQPDRKPDDKKEGKEGGRDKDKKRD